MFFLYILIVLLQCSLGLSEFVVLNETNFEDMVSSGRWIISFYAPWCPHCQKLEPILREASVLIDNTDGLELKFGSVDCTTQTKLVEKFSIQGYPTLKYSYGGRLLEYISGRELEDFVEFANKLVGSPVVKVTISNIEKFIQSRPVKFLYVTNNDNVEIISEFAELWRIYDHLGFCYCNEKSIIPELNSNITEPVSPSLILINDDVYTPLEFYTPPNEYTWDRADVERWMENRTYPVFVEFTVTNWNQLSKNSKTVITLINPKGGNEHLNLFYIMKSVASKYKHKYRFGWFDTELYGRFLSQFGFSSYPAYLIYDASNDIFYTNYTQEFTDTAIISLIEGVEENKIEARGGGSGILGLVNQIYLKISWQIYDHPYIFCALFGFILLFMVLLFYITDPNDDFLIDKDKSD